MRDRAVALFERLQSEICAALEVFEPSARFREDRWSRAGGGGGLTRVLEGGEVFERGGVNTSVVHGELPTDFAATLPGEGTAFWAAGVSLVLHPQNPYVPTVHANYRMIEQGAARWFGGGSDLTPYYLFEEDVRHFHRTLQAACDRHHPAFHQRFKAWCDRYFRNPHRGESRGAGGIFFDRLTPAESGLDEDALLAFASDAGDAFLAAYEPLVERRRDTPYGDRERRWQLLRRGRYVEFNLIHDRGTLFGLRTGGRIESILMSMPPAVAWAYDHRPKPGSPEAALLEALDPPRDWT